MNNGTTNTDQVFHPTEQAILCDWLGRARPVEISDIDIEARLDGADDGPVTLKSTHDGTLEELQALDLRPGR